VKRDQHSTLVRAFPVSVEMQESDKNSEVRTESEQTGLLRELGVEALYLGVGVDRIDYTKGIPERLLAVERFLEKYPLYQGRFTFVQIGAPSRTHIKRYHDLIAEVELETERINWRFQRGKWKPIVFLKRQHSHEEIERYYRGADLCLVTSLHDGMNLVAKEFVAARQDERGVLVLSRFAGAASELRDALIVNPYNIEQTAEAIRTAIEMSLEEKRSRMQRLRKVVRERNAYRWAAELVAELCEVRVKSGSEDSLREDEKAFGSGVHGVLQYRSEPPSSSEVTSGP
jgi:trehalose 6-phosphate synthase